MSTAVTPEAGIPNEFEDYAFEYKLGFEAGSEPDARCPIGRTDFMHEIRKAAWMAGWKERRRQLGRSTKYKIGIRVGRVFGHQRSRQ